MTPGALSSLPGLPGPLGKAGRSHAAGSPAEALTAAFHNTWRLLFRPFDVRRWFKLSLVCLFLGGGTPSAAFNWSLGGLRNDAGVRGAVESARQYASEHLWLVILATVFGLALALVLLYLRAVLRFVLVDAILNRTLEFGRSFQDARALGNSYFRWLLGMVAVIVVALAAGVVLAVRYLRAAAGTGETTSLAFSIALVVALAAVILGSLLAVLLVTLTDDLVVPIMYAERLALAPAWRKLWAVISDDVGAFAVYMVLRFGVSLLVGALVLLILFPSVLSLLSGALIASTLIVVALGMVGLHWVWNPVTILLGALAVLLLTGTMVALLSVVGMPGQVLLQDFGIRFAASRFPALESAWRSPTLRFSD
ncbi:MAG TPA: hypothetical protein VG204_06270 [Terriglobia bacterium]|nr:hypothetical protein [Terriglobia bacterium]